MKLKLLDLFSGIGGFSLGFEKTGGFETIAFCEKDKFCQKVLAKHWNNIKIYDEIRNLKGIQADVITGGFPCQPFSVAGKRKGTDDDRYLWDETLRVIAETKPRWFVGENVEGIINISEGKVLQQIQKDLESENFQVQCLIIPASGVGAWHQRKRVWIIAYSNINSSKIGRNDYADEKIGGKRNLYKGESGSYDRRKFNSKKNAEMEYVSNSSDVRGQNTSTHNAQNGSKEFSKEDVKLGIKSSLSSNVSNSNNNGSHRPKRNATIKSSNKSKDRLSIRDDKDVSNSNGGLRGRRRTIEQSGENEVRRIYSSKEEQARNDLRSKAVGCDALSEQTKSWWQTQSELCGVPNGISTELDKDRSNRIKALGNSIVPEIAYEIAKAILVAENG